MQVSFVFYYSLKWEVVVSFVDNGGIVDHVSQFKLSFHDIIVDLEVHFLVLRSWLMESLMEWIQSMT